MNLVSSNPNSTQTQLRVFMLNLCWQENKSYLLFGDALKSVFIKIENNKINLDSLPLIDYSTFKYKEHFIKASKIELINSEMFIFYDLEGHSFLDFSNIFLESLTAYSSLVIFKNYIKILLALLLLNDDFSLFDPKLFFFTKCPLTGVFNIRYLYHGKH